MKFFIKLIMTINIILNIILFVLDIIKYVLVNSKVSQYLQLSLIIISI